MLAKRNAHHTNGKPRSVKETTSTSLIFPYEVTTTWDLHQRIRNPIADLIPYVKRDIAAITLNRQKVIIEGNSGSGRTRAAVELIRELDHDRQSVILLSNEGVQVPTNLPGEIFRAKRVILFIDDFSRRQANEELTTELADTTANFSDETTRLKKTIEFFEEASELPEFFVIITIHVEEFKYLKHVGMDASVFEQFERITLPPLTAKETEHLIENLAQHLDQMEIDKKVRDQIIEVHDGTFSSLVRFFAIKHQERRHLLTADDAKEYARRIGRMWDEVYFSSDYWERRVIEALSILRQCGVEPYIYLVKALTHIISEGHLRDKDQRIENGIQSLVEREIARRSHEKLLAYDLFLEGKGNVDDYIESVAQLLLKLTKKPEYQVELYPSLLNMSTRLYHRKKAKLTRDLNARIMEINPNFTSTHYDMAVLLAEAGMFEAAEEEYHKILAQYRPENEAGKENNEIYRRNKAEAYYNWGKFLYKQERYEEAEKAFQTAIDQFPNYADAHYSLARLYHRLKRYEEAEEEYKQVTFMINPSDVRARTTYGFFLKDRRRFKEAEHQYRQAIRIDPDFALAHLSLGVLLYQTGKYQEAVAEYRKAIEVDQKNPRAHLNLGKVYQVLAQYQIYSLDDAEREFQRAIELNPNYAEAHNSLGGLLYNQGRLDEAEYHFRRAIEANSNLSSAHYNLTLVFEKRGENAKAVEHWEAIARVNQ
ncbi:MAG: tetratricopeptide repeat protein [Gemmatimonadetes bacterium]|nr:MAG: tetratricopeptide repeat protein [Gemmatimonadota bacterium]